MHLKYLFFTPLLCIAAHLCSMEQICPPLTEITLDVAQILWEATPENFLRAIENNETETVNQMLSYLAQTGKTQQLLEVLFTKSKQSFLMVALEKANDDIINELLDFIHQHKLFQFFYQWDVVRENVLHYAVRRSTQILQKIILIKKCDNITSGQKKRSFHVNKTNYQEQTPLHCAAMQKKDTSQVITVLLNNGANPIALDKWGRSPLHYACSSGVVENVKRLMQPDASPENVEEMKDRSGKTPFEGTQNPEIKRLHCALGFCTVSPTPINQLPDDSSGTIAIRPIPIKPKEILLKRKKPSESSKARNTQPKKHLILYQDDDELTDEETVPADRIFGSSYELIPINNLPEQAQNSLSLTQTREAAVSDRLLPLDIRVLMAKTFIQNK